MVTCPTCGNEIENLDEGCIHCEKNIAPNNDKRQTQADLLMKIGAMIFIFGLFLPILFVTGGIIFGAGAIIWLMYRK